MEKQALNSSKVRLTYIKLRFRGTIKIHEDYADFDYYIRMEHNTWALNFYTTVKLMVVELKPTVFKSNKKSQRSPPIIDNIDTLISAAVSGIFEVGFQATTVPASYRS